MRTFEEYENHIQLHPKCKFCDIRFINNLELKKHYLQFHYICPMCQRKFSTYEEGKIHYKTHPTCEICKVRFFDQNYLKEHKCKKKLKIRRQS